MSLDLPRLIEGSKEEKTGIYWCHEAVCGNDWYWDYLVIQEIVLSLVFFFFTFIFISISKVLYYYKSVFMLSNFVSFLWEYSQFWVYY